MMHVCSDCGRGFDIMRKYREHLLVHGRLVPDNHPRSRMINEVRAANEAEQDDEE